MNYGDEENTNHSQEMDIEFPIFGGPIHIPKQNKGKFTIEYKGKEYEDAYFHFSAELMENELPLVFQNTENDKKYIMLPAPNDIKDEEQRDELNYWIMNPIENPTFGWIGYTLKEEMIGMSFEGIEVDIYQFIMANPLQLKNQILSLYSEPIQWIIQLCWLSYLFIEKKEDLENLDKESYLQCSFNIHVTQRYIGDKNKTVTERSTIQATIVIDMKGLTQDPNIQWIFPSNRRTFSEVQDNYIHFHQYAQNKITKTFQQIKYDLYHENYEHERGNEDDIDTDFKIDGLENNKRFTFHFTKRLEIRKRNKPKRGWKKVAL
jgi:hypothetical protein